MADDDKTLTLEAKRHDKLGSLHCGVTREGFVSVGGDVASIADGEQVDFERLRVSVTRQGGEYTFTRHD
ncbi:MAG: hypothetical protein PVJ66_04335 [Gammaproteobacteria bacterium]|jgi:hypothetical protein